MGGPTRRFVLRALGVAGTGAVVGCTDTRQSTPAGTQRQDSTGPRTSKLAAADGDTRDWFGRSVAFADSGETALVGAPHDEDPNGDLAGSAYVFVRGETWTQQAKLVPEDGESRDFFGGSVALSGDGSTALVASPHDENPAGSASGSVDVFTRSGGTWTQQAKPTPDDGHGFGRSVALSEDGSTALVGAGTTQTADGLAGNVVHVFTRSDGAWTQRTTLVSGDDGDDRFGQSVALSGDGSTALIGAARDDDLNGDDSGAAYVFVRGEAWTRRAKLAPEDGESRDFFGGSVALAADGSTALVGADNDTNSNGDDAGAAYVFVPSGSGWSQQAKLTADSGDSNDRFGLSVALDHDGSTALVGLPHGERNGKSAGSAYAFTRSDGAWTQRGGLVPGDGDAGDEFGRSVALAGDGSTALIAAPNDEDPNGNEAGSAYVIVVGA